MNASAETKDAEREREAELADKRSYGSPSLDCDMVMKGGITSGVVYPLAICELATSYKFHSVGGSSAGAIGAAACAAAERGRHSANGGFHRLATLPDYLGGSLLELFQPSLSTKPLLDLLRFKLDRKKPGGFALLLAVLRAVWSARGGRTQLVVRFALLGVALAAGVAFVRCLGGAAVPTLLAMFAVIACVAWTAVGAAKDIAAFVLSVVRGNAYGVCTGHAEGASAASPSPKSPSDRTAAGCEYALSDFLTDEFDALADMPAGGVEPLCFGHLEKHEHRIKLEMFTTNLTNGRPHRLPFETACSFNTDSFFFEPKAFLSYFPKRVVEWMKNNPPKAPVARDRDWEEWELLCALMARKGLFPFPDRCELPVVVATRMSLSFPGLISAVPLWGIDWHSAQNSAAREAWRARANARRGAGTPFDAQQLVAANAAAPEHLAPALCWFSDGGICSNFPIHFFDVPLPQWPTFGINLRSLPEDRKLSSVQSENVELDGSTGQGQRVPWSAIESVASFGGAIFNTIHNWSDNAQMRAHGYWDRVAHVLLDETHEGGLNLTMPAETVRRLARRGRHAGRKLAGRFQPSAQTTKGSPSWDRHRWIRLRTTMAQLEKLLIEIEGEFAKPGQGGGPSYQGLVARSSDAAPPTGYWWTDNRHEQYSRSQTAALLALAQRWSQAGPRFEHDAPRPRPKLRSMPPI